MQPVTSNQPAKKPEPVTSTHSTPAHDTLVIDSATAKDAHRRAVLQTEVHLLVNFQNTPTAKPMTRWLSTSARRRRGPATIIRRPSARYRMPRRLKQRLIESFCTVSNPEEAKTPTVMIIVAHQDDESIGAGARLNKLTNAYVVHVTDGAPRDERVAQRYGFKTRDEYADARRAEMLKAMKIAGIAEERVLSLNYVDGEAALRMVDLVIDVAKLIDDYQPDVIITHPYEGGHTDHDSTAFAVHLACGLLRREGVEPPAVLEMPAYNAAPGTRVAQQFLPNEAADHDLHVLELSKEDQKLKRKMFEAFQTQQGVLSTFTTEIEQFRPAPRYVFTEPPHEGTLNYERYGDPLLGERWRRYAGEALSRLRMR